jgi:hypothetical protein
MRIYSDGRADTRSTQATVDDWWRPRRPQELCFDTPALQRLIDGLCIPLDVRRVGRKIRNGGESGELTNDLILVRKPILTDLLGNRRRLLSA